MEIDPLLIISVMVTLYVHAACLVYFTTYLAAFHQISAQQIDALCNQLRFPLDFIFALFTSGEPRQYLRIASVTGSSCGAILAIVFNVIIIVPFVFLSFLGVRSGIREEYPIRIAVNLVLALWQVTGIVYAYIRASKFINTHEKSKRKN